MASNDTRRGAIGQTANTSARCSAAGGSRFPPANQDRSGDFGGRQFDVTREAASVGADREAWADNGRVAWPGQDPDRDASPPRWPAGPEMKRLAKSDNQG